MSAPETAAILGWRERVRERIRYLAAVTPTITSDLLRADCEMQRIGEPHHPNAWGAQFAWAAKDGVIRKTEEWVQTEREGGRHREIRVWQSLIFAEACRG